MLYLYRISFRLFIKTVRLFGIIAPCAGNFLPLLLGKGEVRKIADRVEIGDADLRLIQHEPDHVAVRIEAAAVGIDKRAGVSGAPQLCSVGEHLSGVAAGAVVIVKPCLIHK